MNDLIQEKLEEYDCKTLEDEENALKEITQEVALYGLMKAGFFEKVAFQGGTSLRILFKMNRFSEDLDFALQTPNSDFDIDPYLNKMAEIMVVFGHEIEIQGADKIEKSIRSRFIKDGSIKKILNLKHHSDLRKKIQIKIELDINPPAGASYEVNYLDFPIDFMIKAMDLPSLFSGKCHALLCRNYTKGRDWYDYLWYLKKGVNVNLVMLQNALFQAGPWKNKKIKVNLNWLKKELEEKIIQIDWNEAQKDIRRFLKADQKEAIALWNSEFFLKKTKSLSS